jgi:hypothetical protein
VFFWLAFCSLDVSLIIFSAINLDSFHSVIISSSVAPHLTEARLVGDWTPDFRL